LLFFENSENSLLLKKQEKTSGTLYSVFKEPDPGPTGGAPYRRRRRISRPKTERSVSAKLSRQSSDFSLLASGPAGAGRGSGILERPGTLAGKGNIGMQTMGVKQFRENAETPIKTGLS
jgi:hypothetical protein